jgi:hypothetical protein
MKFDVLSIIPKPVEKIQVSLKSDKNNGHFTWRLLYITLHYITLHYTYLLKMRNVSNKHKEKLNTHFMFINLFSKIQHL